MPRRSNPFQRLIALVEATLAPAGARIVESKMVPDLVDGTEREIDVAIEGEVDGRTVLFGLECRDHQRANTVEWIDSLVGKYRTLPVDRVYAVNSAGFSEKARRNAKYFNITLLTLEEAKSLDWGAPFSNLKHITLATIATPRLVSAFAVVFPVGGVTEPPKAESDVWLYTDAGHSRNRLLDVALRCLADPSFVEELRASVPSGRDVVFTVHGRVPQGTFMRSLDGTKYPVQYLEIKTRFRHELAIVPLTQRAYRGARIAAAESESQLGTLTFAFTQRRGAAVQAGLSLTSIPPRHPRKSKKGRRRPRRSVKRSR